MKSLHPVLSRMLQHISLAAGSDRAKAVPETANTFETPEARKGMIAVLRATDKRKIDRRIYSVAHVVQQAALQALLNDKKLLDRIWTDDLEAVGIELSLRLEANINNLLELEGEET